LQLSLSPGGIDARSMAESDCIEDRKSRGSNEATLETATLECAKEGRVSFWGVGESSVIDRLLASGPEGVDPGD